MQYRYPPTILFLGMNLKKKVYLVASLTHKIFSMLLSSYAPKAACLSVGRGHAHTADVWPCRWPHRQRRRVYNGWTPTKIYKISYINKGAIENYIKNRENIVSLRGTRNIQIHLRYVIFFNINHNKECCRETKITFVIMKYKKPLFYPY